MSQLHSGKNSNTGKWHSRKWNVSKWKNIVKVMEPLHNFLTFRLPVSTTTAMHFTVGKTKEETGRRLSRKMTDADIYRPSRHRPDVAITSCWYLTTICSTSTPTHTHTQKQTRQILTFRLIICSYATTHTHNRDTLFIKPWDYCNSMAILLHWIL